MTLLRNYRTPSASRALRLILLACVLTTALVATGCGGSSANEGVATLDDSSAAAAADTTTTDDSQSDDPQQAALDWAACMRKNGVNVSDPEVDSDGRIRIGPGAGTGGATRADADRTKFDKARKACGSPFGSGGGPQLSEADREAMQSAALKFAACMRKNGVDMPDPDFSGGGAFFRGPGQGSGGGQVDPNSATFEKAQKACQSILQDSMPNRGDGGPSVNVNNGSAAAESSS